MALVRNGLSMKMKGRAGSFSFYSSKGRQVVRVSQNSTNYGESARRSEAQQVRRVKWANLVNFYKLTNQTLHGAFETKRSNETDYNAFMRKNLSLATVALTKDQAAMGCVAVQSFILSEGTMPAINATYSSISGAEGWRFSIKAAASSDIGDMTVKAFTESLIANNSWAKVGVQISIIDGTQTMEEGNPRFDFWRHELTLSLSDTRTVAEVLGIDGIKSDNSGFVYLEDWSDDSFIACILSDSTSGQLKVSPARLVSVDYSVAEQFSADAQVVKAIESYGVDASRFLDSGDL